MLSPFLRIVKELGVLALRIDTGVFDHAMLDGEDQTLAAVASACTVAKWMMEQVVNNGSHITMTLLAGGRITVSVLVQKKGSKLASNFVHRKTGRLFQSHVYVGGLARHPTIGGGGNGR